MAVSDACGGKPRYYGEIPNRPASVANLVKKLSTDGEVVSFCYEAGPCGYGVYRQLTGLGHACDVVAPSLIPTKPGERVKTDRRDALQLSRLQRAGELTPVWVPGPEQEAIRDLTRAREDLVSMERRAKQRLGAFLLRHGKVYTAGVKKWTKQYFRWLEEVKFDFPVQQIVFQEYVDTVTHLLARVEALEVEALMALRGIDLVSAMTLMAELGDITRFDSPRQLMAYLGLVPSEHSSGRRQRRGAITRRAMATPGARWWSRPGATDSRPARRRIYNGVPNRPARSVQAIAWKAQKRLCGRYQHLMERGKLKVQVTVAVARELAGFIWAIACEVMGRPVAVR